MNIHQAIQDNYEYSLGHKRTQDNHEYSSGHTTLVLILID